MIFLLAVFAVLSLWLHGGERSLDFAKPWVMSTLNSPDAPFTVNIGQISIDWRDWNALGKIRIREVAVSRRDGSIFAQLPELYATLDPLGFLPQRRLLHQVILKNPRMFATRTAAGEVEFGLEGAPVRMPLKDLVAFISRGGDTDTSATPSLPFQGFSIEDAQLTFNDEISGTAILSEAFDFKMSRHHGTYDAVLSMPFTVDASPVSFSAGLRALEGSREHVLVVQAKQLPAHLLCVFGACPETIEADGDLDGYVAVGIREDMTPSAFRASLSTARARVTAPKMFAETLKLGASQIDLEGDWSKQDFKLTKTALKLEDTNISASGHIFKSEEGWNVNVDAACGKLDITKLYKYWPLVMAPDSRLWVTKKLKSGYAASGKIALRLKPQDFAAEYFSDESVDAVADARDITFEYLPGFPQVEKMNGIAHFTATTVKVEGGGGTLMSGTKVNKAVLWCPKLHSENNPMEATLEVSAPAKDVVNMLALKHFPFDDHLTLDAASIQGTADASLKLKFNAFSNKPGEDPNAIHLDAVDYDITATMKDVAQKKIKGAYDVVIPNGTLKADTKSLNFTGAVKLGELGVSDVTLSQPSGKPLSVSVKGRADAAQNPVNDFSLTYRAAEIPEIELSGKRLDASVSYGESENSILADFPAMKLNIDLGELLLVREYPFREVKASLFCTAARCESADFRAAAGKAEIRGGITQAAGKRQLQVSANDAGAVLKALDITDRMTEGKLDLRGTYNDAKSPPEMGGRMIITDFTLKNSQVLGRIFAIGSLTGLQNALTGSGIAFEKLATNISSQGGVIRVDKGVANGASMGITFGGTVDTNTTKLSLDGVVAPAYALNSILGKIPIIGSIAGGEEGLIAFNYSVNGTYAEPDVGVNPLSGLTPGFLRGIFGGGESDSKPAKNGGSAKTPEPIGEKLKPDAVKR